MFAGFIVSFDHISDLVLVFLLLTLNTSYNFHFWTPFTQCKIHGIFNVQTMNVSIKNFFNKCEQIRSVKEILNGNLHFLYSVLPIFWSVCEFAKSRASSVSRVQMPKCPSNARLPQVLECPSGQVLFKCLSAKVPLRTPCNAQVPFECFLCALLVKNVSNITGNVDRFIRVFFNLFRVLVLHNTYRFFCFLGNRMCEFYHLLLVRDCHSKAFQKLSLNIL